MMCVGLFRKIAIAGRFFFMASVAATGASAQESVFLDVGRLEYEASCAACHGSAGTGDGPVAEVLTSQPADLTTISQRYSGTFPRDFMFEVIDGRSMINPHGDREMPIWGRRFQARAEEQSAAVAWDVDARSIVLGRITALVEYLASIQQ